MSSPMVSSRTATLTVVAVPDAVDEGASSAV
jgi:hypothetical protein